MIAAEAAEHAARESYGRLVAYLARRSRDVAAAEDALADAFAAALATWPRTGVPDRPEAWLMAAARRRLIDAARRQTTRTASQAHLLDAADEAQAMSESAGFPDDRLKLMFVCAHPAIDPAARAALMLQAVLGVEAGRMASAFLISPDAMAKRLVRAKTRIRDAGLRFETPEPEHLAERLNDVLEAVYAAYGLAWDDLADVEGRARDLSGEAIWLGRLLTRLMPDQPEALGLLALMLHCEARRSARRDDGGRYVPLMEQDTVLWDRSLVLEAEAALRRAARFGRLGRFQLEAAIQSAHAERALTGVVPWDQIVGLYRLLDDGYPTVGVRVGLAAALVGSGRALEAVAVLDTLEPATFKAYQPWWAVRARALSDAGQSGEADEAFAMAIGLSADAATRAWLISERSRRRGPAN